MSPSVFEKLATLATLAGAAGAVQQAGEQETTHDEIANMGLAGSLMGDVPLPTEEEMVAHYADWEGRIARADPIEWDAQIRQYRTKSLAEQRRRLQGDGHNWDLETIGELPVDDLTGLDQPAAQQLGSARSGTAGSCADPLATNYNAPTSCRYDCTTLTDQYFHGQAAGTTCFIYELSPGTDPRTGQWPQVGFMDTIRTTLDWHFFVEEDPATQMLEFVVGKGRECSNVTLQTDSMSDTVEEEVTEVCLYEGVHEHVHAEGQSVLVSVDSGATVYANTSQANAGDVTTFTHGECEDIMIRITGTSAGPTQWTLDDARHNGPWTITSSAYPFEHRMCLFDNNFTLTRPAGSNWQGTVTVVSYVDDYTIRLNNHGNYIIQGTEIGGVPVALDARLQSGSLPDTQKAHSGAAAS